MIGRSKKPAQSFRQRHDCHGAFKTFIQAFHCRFRNILVIGDDRITLFAGFDYILTVPQSSPNLCVNSKTYIMSVLTMLPLSLSTALAQCFSVSGMHIRNGLPDVVSYVRRPSLCLLWNEMHIRNGLPDVVSYVRRPSLCLLLNEMHIRNGSPDVVSYVRTKKHRMTCFVRKFWHANQ